MGGVLLQLALDLDEIGKSLRLFDENGYLGPLGE